MKPNIASVAGDFGWQLLCLFLLVDAGSCANCSAVTCFNGGNCNEYTASPPCLCPLPYIAPYCESAADYCFTLQPDKGITELPVCQNGGNCTLTYTDPYFNCSCPDGYAGIRCNELPAVIDVELCGLYATCTNTSGSYNCTCIDGVQSNGKDNCTDVNKCLSSSKCDANADSINLIGSFDCICKPGFYGNGTVCYPKMLLPTVNATNITDHDIVHAPRGVPFLIGSHESSSFQVSNYGAISFSGYLWYLPYNSTTAKVNFPGAVVAPYWFVYPRTWRGRWTPKLSYELLNSRNHSSRSNWGAVKQIIEQEIRSEFNPLTALIVTWRILTPSLPSQYYWNGFDCVRKCHSRPWNQTNGYISLCLSLCSQAKANASIEFQAVVTRNETHSYAIFNYGDFRLPVPRIFNLSSQKWELTAFSGFTDNFLVRKELPFSLRPDWPELPNLSPGSSGRPGRHVLQLSIGNEGAPECGSWIAAARANQSSSDSPGCSDCPFDFRTAVLDRRYRPYDFECSGGSIRMCFSNTTFKCAQSFTGSSASGCKPENSWRCELQNCRHLVSTRCCYRMSSAAAGSEISQLCRRSYPLWYARAVMRRILFSMSTTGHLISRSSDGAGHVRYLYRNSTDDSIQFGFRSPQYQNELYGLRVCSAAGMMAAYSAVRPVCTSENYQPPPPAFNRGDPHLSTLSNRSYTFNGHCEYHLLTSERWPDSPMLRLQARTAPVGGGAATAFVGVALKSGLNDLAVSVIRNESSDDLDVFSSDGRRIGSVRGELAALSNATRLDSYRLEVPDNSTIDIVDESTGVSVTVTMETSSLRVGVQLDLSGKYPSGLDGLLGNSDASGFKLRNGSVLPAGSSERQLFEFGNSWRLNSSEPSYLHYPAGKGRADFCNLSFVPTFAEDFKDNMLALFGGNAKLKNASEEVCRSSGSSYLTCMFDAAQLRSVVAAQDAAVAIRDETRTRVVLANRPAEFESVPSQLRVNGNNSVGVTFSVTDPDGASPNVTVLEAVGGTAKLEAGASNSWQLVWQPVDNWRGDIKLQLAAVDEVGAVTVWTPKIVVCDCASRGSCCPDCDMADDTAYYHRQKCQCQPGFTGPQCEQRIAECSACQDTKEEDKDDEENYFKVASSQHQKSALHAGCIAALAPLILLGLIN